MAKPKHNYNGDEFYEGILQRAYSGLTDSGIASDLGLTPDTFGRMKNGNYEGWSESQNKARSERICRVLARGREKVNSTVRRTYLAVALGGKKTTNTTTVTRMVRLPDGTISDIEEIQKSETEIEMPPSLQALSTWLHHHDPEWRKREEGELEDVAELDIEEDAWLVNNSNDAKDTNAGDIQPAVHE